MVWVLGSSFHLQTICSKYCITKPPIIFKYIIHEWMCNKTNQPTPWPNTLEISFILHCVHPVVTLITDCCTIIGTSWSLSELLSNNCSPCCVWCLTCHSTIQSLNQKPEYFDTYPTENRKRLPKCFSCSTLKTGSFWVKSFSGKLLLHNRAENNMHQEASETLHRGPIYIMTLSRWSLRGVTSGGDLHWAF